MNVIFNQVDTKIIETLMKKQSVVKKRYTDKKQYLIALIHKLYMDL
jgi:hypothetical protein